MEKRYTQKYLKDGSTIIKTKNTQAEILSHGLKQAAIEFWRQLLECMKVIDMSQSTADPCLYFNWTEDGLALIISWIDNSTIVGNKKAVAKTNKALMAIFDYEEYGELDEYVCCKITRIGKPALKITQPVIVQSFSDEFDLLYRDLPGWALC